LINDARIGFGCAPGPVDRSHKAALEAATNFNGGCAMHRFAEFRVT